MLPSRNFRLALFGSLYFAQGAMMSYFLTFNILYLGEFGYGEADVGVFQAVLAVPFVLKIFLGCREPFWYGTPQTLHSHRPGAARCNDVGPGQRLAGRKTWWLCDPRTHRLYRHGTVRHLHRWPCPGHNSPRRARPCPGSHGRGTGSRHTRHAAGRRTNRPDAGLAVGVLRCGSPRPLAHAAGLAGKRNPCPNAPECLQSFQTDLLAAAGFIYSWHLHLLERPPQRRDRSIYQQCGALAMVGRIVGALSNSWLTDRIGHKQSLWVAIALTSGSRGRAHDNSHLWLSLWPGLRLLYRRLCRTLAIRTSRRPCLPSL